MRNRLEMDATDVATDGQQPAPIPEPGPMGRHNLFATLGGAA